MISRIYSNFSRFDDTTEISFDEYKKQFYDVADYKESPVELQNYFIDQIRNYGMDSFTPMEHELPRSRNWNQQKLNLWEHGDISDKTPLVGDGELILPFMDHDPRGAREDPNMRKITEHSWMRKNGVPYTDSSIDGVSTAPITDLSMIKRKDLIRRGFEKRYKNFEESNGNMIKKQLGMTGFDNGRIRRGLENEQYYQELHDFNHRYPFNGVEELSNNMPRGVNQVTSHKFAVSEESKDYEQAKELAKVYKSLRSSLLDNPFGDSSLTKNNETFIQTLFNITNEKKSKFLDQENLPWYSNEGINRSMKTYTDDVSKIKWDTITDVNHELVTVMNNKWFAPDVILKNKPNKSNIGYSIIHINEGELDTLVIAGRKNKIELDDINKIYGMMINDKVIKELDDKSINNYKQPKNNLNMNKIKTNADMYYVHGISLVPKRYVTNEPQYDNMSRIKSDKTYVTGQEIIMSNKINDLDPKARICNKFDVEYDKVKYGDVYDRDILMGDSIGTTVTKRTVDVPSSNVNKILINDYLGEYDRVPYNKVRHNNNYLMNHVPKLVSQYDIEVAPNET